MAFGVKTNERPGTRAQVKYVRVSAYKAREILDLIRGESYGRASEILQFSERAVARTIRKCLDSAVANAENNDHIPAEELYISACYADEGPTLKRWRPRARGRATRIRKRTCHITIIVTRYSPAELERQREREGSRSSAQAARSRRDRVARSRAAEAAREAEHDHDHDHDHDHGDAVDAVTEPTDTDETVDEATAADEAVEAEGPYGADSAVPLDDGGAPEGFTIKGNADSMLYHPPESPFYERTIAEVWFRTAEAAEAAGFSLPSSMSEDGDDAEGEDS